MDMGAVSDDLAKISESGNVQALTQQAVAAGSVMNKGSKGNSTGGNETASREAVEVHFIYHFLQPTTPFPHCFFFLC